MPARPRKAPRYDDCRPASPAASKAKRRNRPKGTVAELLLRRALWAEGLRYRLHAKDLPGKPDIVFRRQRLVIFVDGDFWHGRDWPQRREKLEKGSNPEGCSGPTPRASGARTAAAEPPGVSREAANAHPGMDGLDFRAQQERVHGAPWSGPQTTLFSKPNDIARTLAGTFCRFCGV
jgi:DNA mismatch endonuclease Vsr